MTPEVIMGRYCSAPEHSSSAAEIKKVIEAKRLKSLPSSRARVRPPFRHAWVPGSGRRRASASIDPPEPAAFMKTLILLCNQAMQSSCSEKTDRRRMAVGHADLRGRQASPAHVAGQRRQQASKRRDPGHPRRSRSPVRHRRSHEELRRRFPGRRHSRRVTPLHPNEMWTHGRDWEAWDPS